MITRIVSAAACTISLLCAETGASPHSQVPSLASARIVASALPYLPGSMIPLQIQGTAAPYSFDVLGDGNIEGNDLRIAQQPAGAGATVIASAGQALAVHRFDVAQPPNTGQSFLAVASYDNGVVIHEANAPFDARAVLGVGGAPADVALDTDARLAAGDTSGDTLMLAQLDPWHVSKISNVPFADELEFDPISHDLFATNRDISGNGALTRVSPDGSVSRRILGITSEGIAIDGKRARVYVANTNDGTISIVDVRTMRELQRFKAVDRVFSLALSKDGKRLYAVSNQSVSSPFAALGGVVAIDVAAARPRVITRSATLAFPVGIVADAAHHRLFVTDEHDNSVAVLDSDTLRAVHPALRTCRTPWKPAIDAENSRLYVPCAQADQIDAFDTGTLRRINGAPFATGGYPLAVAVWHPRHRVVR